MNKTILMGRIGGELELRRTASDIPVLSFSIAVNRPKNKDGAQVTDWIDLVAWRHNAEFISKYFSKGKMIAIEGTLQTRNYEDKTGAKRKAVEVLIDKSHFCGDGQNSGGGNNRNDEYNQDREQGFVDEGFTDDSDLPF